MFSLEHSKASYWIDYLAYALAVAGLGASLCAITPAGGWLAVTEVIVAGLFGWSLVEYLMHRFVLHAVEPFKSWHTMHHGRPAALISAPTLLSATLLTLLVFVPALIASSLRYALSLTLGVTVGYLAYSICHHATHHWRIGGSWMKERKRWHAIHHVRGGGECYGVTSGLWDHVFRTGPTPAARRKPRADGRNAG
jgi:cyclopropane-fatty-acyl-phospholipid synthase